MSEDKGTLLLLRSGSFMVLTRAQLAEFTIDMCSLLR